MNAIVGLCHFCEAHGPRPLFCTFTTDNETHTTESSQCSAQCTGCTSLGSETVLVSRDDNGTIYCSRESVPNADVTSFLRHAAVRSITCEVSWSKEGGVVYFSDSRGHVLSFTFQIKDTRARGLKRWFSIVVLMKDNMLLLNIMPLLSEHMQKIAKELQEMADIIYDKEQKICSQRALRLNTGRNDFGQSRSLIQLTGNEDIFKRLHSQFTWMLKSGSLTYTETLYTSEDLLKKLQPKNKRGSIFEPNACLVPVDEGLSLRALESLVSKSGFRILLYCALVGVDIFIKMKNTDPGTISKVLARLMPVANVDRDGHIKVGDGSVANNACLLEEHESDGISCRWSGLLPAKCPTLMNKIENGMSNDKFNDSVLHQHVKSLLLEWLGIARTVTSAIRSSGAKSEAVVRLKRVLGVSQYDEVLLHFWIRKFC